MRSLTDSRTRWEYTFDNASNISDLRASVRRGIECSTCTHGLRSVCWKAFLVFENLDQSTWSKTLRDARSAYSSLKEHLLRDIKHSNDVSGDDPLADDEASPWTTLRKDEVLRAEIFQDIERCMPENRYFREPETQSILLDILFIYCKLNADVGYRQGMHEILAPIVWVISRDAVQLSPTEDGSATVGDDDQLILSILSEKHIEHDAFTLFGILMQTAKSFYEVSPMIPSKSGNLASVNSAIVDRSRRIHEELLHKVDPELALHLTDIDILPQIFVIRWIRLLFGREFPFEDVLCLWDVMFAEDPGLSLVDYVCVAMLLRVRWRLVAADHTTALALLLRYPPPASPHGPATFIEDASRLRRSLTQNTGTQLIIKYSDTPPTMSGTRNPQTPTHSPRVSGDFSITRSPLRSPGQIFSDSGGIEGLLQEAAKGMYRRSEQWGLGQALRTAVQGLQSGGVSPYITADYGHPGTDDSREEIAGLEARIHAIEERSEALAKMLHEAVEELLEQAKDLEAQKQDTFANKLTLTVAKLQFVQVHIENSTLPLGGGNKVETEKGSGLASSESLDSSASSTSPGLSSSALPTRQAQRRLSKPSESGLSPVRAPTRKPPNISTVPKTSVSQDSLNTPETASPFHLSRPSLASSSFSWMLGSEENKSTFTATSLLTPEKGRKAIKRGKVGFLFGDDAEDSMSKQKEKKKCDKEDDDGFTLGTLRGVDKR